ncbi:pentapeptide repeat-containing protein [Methylophaga sp. OBS3]|uniref:pentapeptide repeat-containing protein n=1 Tax=Methylophaga sp. OBS3 TaxID=2991934 RepID=UPI00225BFCFE|nr:pentapeptide repeat-containing protein [Methylophaga sp. OBS3]MCX4189757.1 pentapeptide repeat-containing protein [Methylophaga sp. OBS3]
MAAPIISHDPLYRLLRDGQIEQFNQRVAAGEVADLTGCDFRHMNLQGLNADKLDLSNAYLRQADLRGIDFRGCKGLEGASIHGAKISGVYFPKELSPEEITLSLQHGTRMRYSS